EGPFDVDRASPAVTAVGPTLLVTNTNAPFITLQGGWGWSDGPAFPLLEPGWRRRLPMCIPTPLLRPRPARKWLGPRSATRTTFSLLIVGGGTHRVYLLAE